MAGGHTANDGQPPGEATSALNFSRRLFHIAGLYFTPSRVVLRPPPRITGQGRATGCRPVWRHAFSKLPRGLVLTGKAKMVSSDFWSL
jgi:hypothetical protein